MKWYGWKVIIIFPIFTVLYTNADLCFEEYSYELTQSTDKLVSNYHENANSTDPEVIKKNELILHILEKREITEFITDCLVVTVICIFLLFEIYKN